MRLRNLAAALTAAIVGLAVPSVAMADGDTAAQTTTSDYAETTSEETSSSESETQVSTESTTETSTTEETSSSESQTSSETSSTSSSTETSTTDEETTSAEATSVTEETTTTTEAPVLPECIELTGFYDFHGASGSVRIVVDGEPGTPLCVPYPLTLALWSFDVPGQHWPQTIHNQFSLTLTEAGEFWILSSPESFCGQLDLYNVASVPAGSKMTAPSVGYEQFWPWKLQQGDFGPPYWSNDAKCGLTETSTSETTISETTTTTETSSTSETTTIEETTESSTPELSTTESTASSTTTTAPSSTSAIVLTSSVAGTTTLAFVVAASNVHPASLPHTGFSEALSKILWIAAIAIVLGAGLVILGRRSARKERQH